MSTIITTATDEIEFVEGSPRSKTNAQFFVRGRWNQGMAASCGNGGAPGYLMKSGWQLWWDTTNYVGNERDWRSHYVTVPTWTDMLALIALGPVEAADRYAKAMAAVAGVFGFEVAAFTRR